MIIFIIGPRSFGKTTTGKIVVKKIGYEFTDIDDLVLGEIGDVNEFFKKGLKQGMTKQEKKLIEERNTRLFYSKFHKHLRRVLNESKEKSLVLTLGGGLLISKNKPTKSTELINQYIKKHGGVKVLVQLDENVDECIRMVWNREQKRQRGITRKQCETDMKDRIYGYREIADWIITGKTSKGNAKKITKRLLDKN